MNASRAVASLSVMLAGAAYTIGASAPPVPYPADFREWAHVKSVLVGPQAQAYPTEGGIHHIYANPTALEGYRTGRFPDGSVIVYNLLEVTENAGMTVEGATRRVDVMLKDRAQFAETGGWGLLGFELSSSMPQLSLS